MQKTKNTETYDREIQALELRRQGHTYQQISDQMGLGGPGVAHRIIRRTMEQTITENVEQTREIELQRLDGYLTRLQPRIQNGDTKAIDTALKIMDRRAKMLGLDAPTKVQAEITNHDTNSIDAEVARLIALLDSSPTNQMDPVDS